MLTIAILLALGSAHAQLFNVDPCCTSSTNSSCCVVNQVTPSINLATRLELVNVLCSPFCARYQQCIQSLGNQSTVLAPNNTVANASSVSFYSTVNFVLGPNYCSLQCLNDGGAFGNATFQRSCLNAATVNGTCSDPCRNALRQVDPACRLAMQQDAGAELQMYECC